MAGSRVTPRPEPTICTRVCSEVAAKSLSPPLAPSTLQADRACSRRQWPSSSRMTSSCSMASGFTVSPSKIRCPAGAAASSSSSSTGAVSSPVVS